MMAPNQVAAAVRMTWASPEKNFARGARFAASEPRLRVQPSLLSRRWRFGSRENRRIFTSQARQSLSLGRSAP